MCEDPEGNVFDVMQVREQPDDEPSPDQASTDG